MDGPYRTEALLFYGAELNEDWLTRPSSDDPFWERDPFTSLEAWLEKNYPKVSVGVYGNMYFEDDYHLFLYAGKMISASGGPLKPVPLYASRFPDEEAVMQLRKALEVLGAP